MSGLVFDGMMITLSKRMPGVCTEEGYPFVMFGHYDSMSICNVDKWYDLRPRGLYENNAQVKISDDFLDKYTLKLYFPEDKICAEMQEYGFTYDVWKDINTEWEDRNHKRLLENNPFISVAVVRIAKESWDTQKNILLEIGKKISVFLKKQNYSKDLIHFAIFPSISYADFVLLFLSQDPEIALQIMNFLRAERLDNNPLLTSTYVITGFAKEGLKQLHNLNLKDIELSIRVVLRRGVSPNHFKKYFDDNYEDLKKAYKKKCDKEYGTELYEVFGNSDCLIISNMPFDFFIPQYFSKGLFTSNELFKKYILNIRSSLRIKIDQLHQELGELDNNNQHYNKELFDDIISKLTNFVDKYSKPIRVVCGLERVMKNYISLVVTGQCVEAEKIVGPAFEVLYYNIDRSIQNISEYEKVSESLNDSDKTKCLNSLKTEEIKNLMEAVTFFRDRIEGYLIDLQRSDRLFIEGQELAHPSVASATKLLFFYNEYINHMARELVDTESEETDKAVKNKYIFVVTSGGCDETKAWDLFSYLNPSIPGSESLILISIPEMSLYDIKGTLLRLLHECLHFCGKRNRKERGEALIEAISLYFSNSIAGFAEYIISNDLNGEIVYSVQSKLTDEERNCLTGGMNEMLVEQKKEFANLLKPELQARFRGMISGKEEDYYLRYLEKRFLGIGEKIFMPMPEKEEDSNFLMYVFKNYLEFQKKSLEQMLGILNSYEIIYSNADILLEMKKLDKKKWEDKREEIIAQVEFKNFKTYFEAMFNNKIWDQDIQIDNSEIVKFHDVVVIILATVKECYADCVAVTLLDVNLEDFLLSFVYETWDIFRAIPRTTMEAFRLGLDLWVLYGIRGELGCETVEKLNRRILYWQERGFDYVRGDISAESLICHINLLLADYTKPAVLNFIAPVERYIKACIEEMKRCEKSFRFIGGMSMKEADMKNEEELYSLLARICRTK